MRMIKNIFIEIITIMIIIGLISGIIFVPMIKFLEFIFPGNSIIIIGMLGLLFALWVVGNKYIEGGE